MFKNTLFSSLKLTVLNFIACLFPVQVIMVPTKNDKYESPQFIPVKSELSGRKKEDSALILCLASSYGVCYGSTTIHHGGAMNARDASTIRYGASTV